MGQGYVKSRETVALEILRELQRDSPAYTGSDVYVDAHPDVVSYFHGSQKKAFRELEKISGKKFHLRSHRDKHPEWFEIAS
ncbi:MAG: hypothetical protein ACNA8W_01420 [Bradymonadaceae bacterium]